MVPELWITKSTAAIRLGVSPAAVSKYCARGLQQAAGRKEDGLLLWSAVSDWHRLNICPRKSGSYRHRMLKRAAMAAQRAALGIQM